MNIIETDTAWRQPIQVLPLTQLFPQMDNVAVAALSNLTGGDFHQYREKKVVVSEDRERLFGVFSAKSPLIKHTELAEILGTTYNRLFGEDPTISVKSMDDGAKVVMEISIPLERPLDVGNGDVSDLMLYAQNSYDHNMGLKIRMGVMRLICTNGAIAGRQIGDISSRELMGAIASNTLAARLNRLIVKSNDLVSIWQSWMDVEIPRLAATLILNRHFTRKFADPLLEGVDFPISKYELYNLVTRRSTHDVLNDKSRWGTDNLIARLFYSDTFERGIHEIARMENQINLPNEEIRDTVTETDDILHA